jgi:tripartite-type tricarboxylate transporter receptor subunit TctC
MKINISWRRDSQGYYSLRPAAGILAYLLIVSLTILVLPASNEARDWPTKPISIIVPWAVGGSTDLAARILATKISKILAIPIQVISKPGGSGIIGTLEAVKSVPDGYTLLMDSNGTSSIQYAWSENLPYKVEERTYIARATFNPLSLIVPASSPWNSVEDLVNAIRTDPASISYGVLGGTGVPDVDIAQFQAAMVAKGVDISKVRAVAYKGSGEVGPAIAGGHVSFTFSGPSSIISLISAGKIRALAVTSVRRYNDWPNVPTMTEVGFPSVNTLFWTGLSGPSGLPANIANTLDNALRESLNDPDVIAKLYKLGIAPFYQPGDAYRKFVFTEGETIKSLKLK